MVIKRYFIKSTIYYEQKKILCELRLEYFHIIIKYLSPNTNQY